MESGLDGRNNLSLPRSGGSTRSPRSLNGVRPRWPEQSEVNSDIGHSQISVSMESGLDGRNNHRLTYKPSATRKESQWSPA